jgi:hypothetical protein
MVPCRTENRIRYQIKHEIAHEIARVTSPFIGINIASTRLEPGPPDQQSELLPSQPSDTTLRGAFSRGVLHALARPKDGITPHVSH